MGDRSGKAITTGNYNTAVGGYALGSNTTGSNHVAIGYDALSTLSNQHSGSVAIGMNALKVSVSAANSTAVGASAGESLTTGHSNTFIGSSAGGSITTQNAVL